MNDAEDAGLSSEEVREKHLQYGYNEVPEKKQNIILRFVRKFWGITPWMLEIAIVLTFMLGKYSDSFMVLFLLIFNSILGFVQEERANTALEFLKKKLNVNARVQRDGRWSLVPARELVPGDLVRLRAGDFVPADISIIEGSPDVDQSSLTGESFIAEKKAGDILYSGTVVRRGEASGIVTAIGTKTYFGRTVELVQIAKPKLRMERVTSSVVKWLMLIIAALLLLGFAVQILKGNDIVSLLPLAVILLISAIPVALPTIFIISAALGSLELAKKGALVTRLNTLENAATMDVLCVDKTGTVTMNVLSIAETLPIDGFSEKDVLLYGALASREANKDPIDIAFISSSNENGLDTSSFLTINFKPFDPSNRRTEATIEKDGQSFIVYKGALNTIIPLCKNGVEDLANAEKTCGRQLSSKGYKAIAVAKGSPGGDIRLVGVAFLYDKPRPDSSRLIKKLDELGIDVKMLTGDALPIAVETARSVGIGDNIVNFTDVKNHVNTGPLEKFNGFAEIYPEDKFYIVDSLQKGGHVVGMTGDGVNDTPALKQADVGIAVSNAADVAKKAAGVVLTGNGVEGILDLVINGRMIYKRVLTWIFNKIVKTLQVIIFIILAFILTGQYLISISGIVLFYFLTDFVTLTLSTDNAIPSKKPDSWDITAVVKTAVPLGIVLVIESFLLYYAGVHYLGISDADSTYTFVFDILMFISLLDVLIVRERGHFWESQPGKFVLLSIIADILVVIVISVLGLPGLAAIGIGTVLTVLAVSIILTFVVNDLIKVWLVRKLWKR